MVKIERVSDEDIHAMIDDDLVIAHRMHGLSPERPVVRGTTQNSDVYFQGRETVNPFVNSVPDAVQVRVRNQSVVALPTQQKRSI